jgi:predicted O-linked N-acetylglucosamine transferase (SPINDLY family)
LDGTLSAAWNNLSVALRLCAAFGDAAAAAMRALELRDDSGVAHENAAAALLPLGKLDEALMHARRAVQLSDQSAYAWFYLANALYLRGEHTEAAQAYRRALQLDPLFADARTNLASALHGCGAIAEALAVDREAIPRSDDPPRAHSRMLFTLNFVADLDRQRIFDEHREWGRRYADALSASAPPHGNDRSSGRRLRIGYVSPDFLAHAVARFFEPLLEAHDRDRLEVYCYCNAPAHDGVTQRLQRLSHTWREIDRLNDPAAAKQVRDDRIDILVDLAGHTSYNRMMLFAHRPAPVQMTYLGYPNTTGTIAIDARITDAIADPIGDGDSLHTERLVRLPRTAWCYRPPEQARAILPSRADASHVTFASFNNLAKINDHVLDLWARIVHGTPGARLMLKALDLRDPESRNRLRAALRARGIEDERIEVLPATPTLAAHYATFAQIDVALDPFPYNGTTTTCDALWMGVPVVALRGDRHCGRVSASLLSALALDNLIADTADAYVSIATELARDEARRRTLRSELRERMRQSPLMDAAGLARAIEQVYRDAWAAWITMH